MTAASAAPNDLQRRILARYRECLGRILIYSPRHLLAILGEFVAHYNGHRPLQGRHQYPPDGADAGPAAVVDLAARIRRKTILDGLINEYSQAA
jgi:hypothetical protein